MTKVALERGAQKRIIRKSKLIIPEMQQLDLTYMLTQEVG